MKKVTLADQLDLTKEIVASLSEEQLQEIEGGVALPSISCIGGTNSCSHSALTEEGAAE